MSGLKKYSKSFFKYKGKNYDGYCLHYQNHPGDFDFCRDWTEIVLCPELNALFVIDRQEYRNGKETTKVKLLWDFKENSGMNVSKDRN